MPIGLRAPQAHLAQTRYPVVGQHVNRGQLTALHDAGTGHQQSLLFPGMEAHFYPHARINAVLPFGQAQSDPERVGRWVRIRENPGLVGFEAAAVGQIDPGGGVGPQRADIGLGHIHRHPQMLQ